MSKLNDITKGALETICGLWTYQMAARADSSEEREMQADLGNHEMDYGEAKFMEGWYAPWTIWVPNYDENTLIRSLFTE